MGVLKMVVSYDEWLQTHPELQNPLMSDNSDFIKKLDQDDWEQALQFLFSIIQKEKITTKQTITSLINNSYINNKASSINVVHLVEVRDYIENIL
jgi:hypothetical protein